MRKKSARAFSAGLLLLLRRFCRGRFYWLFSLARLRFLIEGTRPTDAFKRFSIFGRGFMFRIRMQKMRNPLRGTFQYARTRMSFTPFLLRFRTDSLKLFTLCNIFEFSVCLDSMFTGKSSAPHRYGQRNKWRPHHKSHGRRDI